MSNLFGRQYVPHVQFSSVDLEGCIAKFAELDQKYFEAMKLKLGRCGFAVSTDEFLYHCLWVSLQIWFCKSPLPPSDCDCSFLRTFMTHVNPGGLAFKPELKTLCIVYSGLVLGSVLCVHPCAARVLEHLPG